MGISLSAVNREGQVLSMKRITAIAVLLVLWHFGSAQSFQTILIEYRRNESATQVTLVDRHRQTSQEFQAPWSSVWEQVMAFYTGEALPGADLVDVITYFGNYGWELAAGLTDPDTGWVSYYFQINCLYADFC